MRDWYGYLRLPPNAATEEIEQAVERLSRQAAALATTAPERSQSLRETVRSIKRDLLSGPDSRQRYDESMARRAVPDAGPAQPSAAGAPAGPGQPPVPGWPARHAPPPAPPPAAVPAGTGLPPGHPPAARHEPSRPGWPAGPGMPPGPGTPGGSRLARFLRTGWTCTACGKGAVPSDKFCTRCGAPIRLIEAEPAGQGQRAPRSRAACPGCANPLGALDVFCSKCGTRR